MKLSTYNFLSSKAMKGVKVGYPLKLVITKKDAFEITYNPLFVTRLLPKLDWQAVYLAAQVAEEAEDVPAELPANVTENDELLRKLHHLLLEVDVIEGHLQCPESGRIFPIMNGIPDMLLNEDEV